MCMYIVLGLGLFVNWFGWFEEKKAAAMSIISSSLCDDII